MSVISVVVPLYNAENTINKCLDSILAQTFSNIEIICVNDGSTDNTGSILDEYARLHSNVVVIHIENSGVTVARKIGIAKASGEYIGFVDGDDWIEKEMFSKLYEAIVKHKADMVCSGYYFEGDYVSECYDGVDEGLYSDDGIRYLCDNAIYNVDTRQVGLRSTIWCKLFSAEIVQEIQREMMDELSFSEDKVLILLFLMKCQRVYVLHEAYYHYVKNSQSTVNKPNFNYLLSINDLYKQLRLMYGYERFSEKMRAQAEIYITELLYKGINSRMGFERSNLLWIDPYWLEQLPKNSKLYLYGVGELCKTYLKQLRTSERFEYMGCIDYDFEKHANDELKPGNPSVLKNSVYDYVVVTIKNKSKAADIQKQLVEDGIPVDKIKWFDQTEIFWRFAEANGWFK